MEGYWKEMEPHCHKWLPSEVGIHALNMFNGTPGLY